MKRIIIALAILTFFCFLPNLSSAGISVVIYVEDDFEPYSYLQGNEIKGLYCEILKAAFSRMEGYDVRIDAVPWKRGLRYMETGEGFALCAPYFRPKERPYISPYSVPFFEEEVVVFCRQKDLAKTPRPNWPADFKGLFIGRNSGYLSGGNILDRAVKEGVIFLDEYKGTRENIIKLFAGRIDGYINDRLVIKAAVKRIQKDEGLYPDNRLTEAAIVSTEKVYLGYTAMDKSRFPFKKDFIKKFDAVIEEMKKNGEITAIADKFRKSE